MEKEKILERVIAKLKQFDQEDLEKFSANLNQKNLNTIISKIKLLTDPNKVKEIVVQFDDVNNENAEQAPRLEILNEIKKNNLFRISGFNMIKGMDEMWHRLAKEWKITYKFES